MSICKVCKTVFPDYLSIEEEDTLDLSKFNKAEVNAKQPRKVPRQKGMRYLAKCPNKQIHNSVLRLKGRCAKVVMDDSIEPEQFRKWEKKANAALRIVETRLKRKGELSEWSLGKFHYLRSTDYSD